VLRLATNGDRAVLIGVDHCAIGHTSGEYQRHMTRTRRDDRLDLGRRCRDFQQRLKTVGLPRALFVNQP